MAKCSRYFLIIYRILERFEIESVWVRDRLKCGNEGNQMNSHNTVFDCSRQTIIKRTTLHCFKIDALESIPNFSERRPSGISLFHKVADVFLGYLYEISGAIIRVIYDHLCISYFMPWGSSTYFIHKVFRETKTFYPLIRTRSSAHQEVRNVILKNFA